MREFPSQTKREGKLLTVPFCILNIFSNSFPFFIARAPPLIDTKYVMQSTKSAASKLWSYFTKDKPLEPLTPPPQPKYARLCILSSF